MTPLAITPPPRERAAVSPGLIFALAVVGAGDYVANAAIGATYGTALLWALLLAAACRYVWIEACARLVLVTGQTPFQGFARLNRGLLWLVMVTLFVHRHTHGLYQILFMGLAFQALVPLPLKQGPALWSLFFVAAGLVMILWPGYRVPDKFFKLILALKGAALILVVAMAPPNLGDVLTGLFIPSLPDANGPYSATLLLTALLGTEACSLSNITYSYFMWQKGWRDISYQTRQRKDLLFGIGAMFAMGCFLQVAAAGAIGLGGAVPKNVEDLIRIFAARLGLAGHIAFSLGIWAAVLTAFIGGISGYSMAITDVIRTFKTGNGESHATRDELKRDPLFFYLVLLFAFSPLYILVTHVRPVWLVLAASSASVVMVPIISISLLLLTSNKDIMGEHRNRWPTNAVLVLLSGLSCYFIYKNVVELWAKYAR